MKRLYSLLTLFLLMLSGLTFGQIARDSIDSYIASIEKYRKGINIKMMYTDKTPLTPKQHESFEGLKYYPPNIQYLIHATIHKNPEAKIEVMRTSTERAPEYVRYGFVEFDLQGKHLKLTVYQSKKREGMKEDKTLFIPFRDETSGKETYGGGRYIESEIPESGTALLLDFNKAYNPYCAYNSRYSCVIPPEENRLPVRIEAGEKIFEAH